MYILVAIFMITTLMIIEFIIPILSMCHTDFLFWGMFIVCSFITQKVTTRLVKSNLKNTKIRTAICILTGAVVFIGCIYSHYKSSGSNSSMLSYIKYTLDINNLKFRTSHGGHVGTYPTAGIPNYIIFLLQFICAILGAYHGYNKRITYYCDDCKKYYISKKIFSSTKQTINFSDLKKLKPFIKSHTYKPLNYKNIYEGTLCYCDKCMNGKIIIHNKIKTTEKYNKRRENDILVDLNPDFVKDIL